MVLQRFLTIAQDSLHVFERCFCACAQRLQGDVEFDHVDFKFEGMQSNLLKGISFAIKPGSFVGICGERGAGKSTLFKVLACNILPVFIE